LLRLLARVHLLGPAYRLYEALLSLRPEGPGSEADGLPVPPRRLRVKVAGTADLDWFLEGGRLAADSIRDALARHGASLDELGPLLDFGCGCGRVTRRWRGRPQVHGSDTSEEAIAWCRRNLPFARFEVNGLAPPLVFDDGSFELVYALSVFTHLPLDLQHAWRRELHRLLRPGGYLLLTTHGLAYADRLRPDERARFDAGEVVVRWQDVAGTNLCSAFHPEAALRGELAEGFAVLELVAEGARGNPRQDLVLLQKRHAPRATPADVERT
jgi:SAM-dependent methyltransferase